MNQKLQITPGTQLPLRLTRAERKLALDWLQELAPRFTDAIRATREGRPTLFTLDELRALKVCVRIEADGVDDPQLKAGFEALALKVQYQLDTHTEEVPAPPPPQASYQPAAVETTSAETEGADTLVKWAEAAQEYIEDAGIEDQPVDRLRLLPVQRKMLEDTPGIPCALLARLSHDTATFTAAEVVGMAIAISKAALRADFHDFLPMCLLADHLLRHVPRWDEDAEVDEVDSDDEDDENDDDLEENHQRGQPVLTDLLFQFKITLKGTKPPIWRRIVVADCTLKTLHGYIQAAMGWTNSHLHEFEIRGESFGDPQSSDGGWGDAEWDDDSASDTSMVALSEVVVRTHKKFKFTYTYDFGDHWEHEILFEGCPARDPAMQYPVCTHGARACPPEDSGGVWEFQELVQALGDPRSDRHEDALDWGETFDQAAFDASQATQAMRGGLSYYDC